MDKTDRLRDYGLAFLLYEQGLGVCGYELIRELFIFIKLILNSYLLYYAYIYLNYREPSSRRSHPAKYGETSDGPTTLERSGSEHAKSVRLHPRFLRKRGLGRKWSSLWKGRRRNSKNI